MKRIFTLLFIVLSVYKVAATNYNMQNGTFTVTCPGPHNFYDSGGNTGGSHNYANSESYVITFYPSTAGQCLQIAFSAFNTEGCCDFMTIYNGPNTSSPVLGNFSGTTIPPVITSTGGPITIRFTSDGSVVSTGWAATINCVACPPPPSYYQMSNSTVTVTCPGPTQFYDSGGPTGNYSNSENYTMTFYPSTVGQCIQLAFSAFNTESCCDQMVVYNGANTASPILGTFAGTTVPSTVTSTGGPITVKFTSDGSVNNAGWTASVSCVACPPPPNYYTMDNTNVTLTCPPTYSLFYDSGGPTVNYANSESYTKTFTAPAGYCLRFSFNSAFQTESCCDNLQIYDGPNTASPLVGTYLGTTGPGIVTSSGSSITFNFTSDGSVVYAGWEATITCVPACSGIPNGGAGTVTGGGCLGTASVQLSSFGSTTGCGITYQWQSGTSATGPWSNVAGANSNTLVVPTSTNTYYHLNVTCGGNTASGTSVLGATSTTAATCDLSTYIPSNIAYSFDTFVGTTCPNTDDVIYTNIAMLGFQFCFTGNAYWGGYISSNGAFIFDAVPCFPNVYFNQNAAAGIGTGWSIAGPAPSSVSVTSLPQNAINAPWHDVNPGLGGVIRYGTLGTSPNRRFVVSYENVPMFSCGTSSPSIYYTAQIKLFETTNNIEIHVGKKGVCPGWNNGQAILGLTSYDGLAYNPPVNATAHNANAAAPYNQWNMTNTAYRWTSPCAGAGGPCKVLPINFKNFYGERVDRVNKLFWETAEEKNVKTFIVERSSEAENFTEIGRVLPNNSPSKYSFNDNFAQPGTINYYRISALENDGKRSSTHIVPLGANANEIAVSGIYPNPVDGGNFTMVVDSKISSELFVNFYDTYGRLVKTVSKTVNNGSIQLNLNCDELESGVYTIEVTDNGKNVVSKQKLVKVGRE